MIRINAAVQADFAALGLGSVGDFTRLFTGDAPIRRDEEVWVKPASLAVAGGRRLAVYFKLYGYHPPIWKFVGRPSKARCEYRNYEAMRALGIPTAEPLAWGEERDGWGRLRRAFIVTRAIEGALPLPEFVRRHCPDPKAVSTRAMRRSLIGQVAALTRRMHDAGFFHHDLVLRNALVTATPENGAQVWWIDSPRGRLDRWSPWRRRRRIKDLASLLKSSEALGTTRERLRFLHLYLRPIDPTLPLRRLMRDVWRYRHDRWAEATPPPGAA